MYTIFLIKFFKIYISKPLKLLGNLTVKLIVIQYLGHMSLFVFVCFVIPFFALFVGI